MGEPDVMSLAYTLAILHRFFHAILMRDEWERRASLFTPMCPPL